MGRLLDWLNDKRREVQQHFDEKKPPCRPTKEWWIEVYALANVIKTVNYYIPSSSGKAIITGSTKRPSRKATKGTDANWKGNLFRHDG